MKITLLGTGTPAPSLERMSSGYLVELGRDVIVLDHGPGAQHRLMQSGRRAVDVTHAFFSHLHYDHCMDYARLVLQRWDMGANRIPELDVFGPTPISRMTALLFGEDGVYGPDIRARTEHKSSLDVFAERGGVLPRPRPAPHVTEVHAGDVIERAGWRVTVGHARHVQPHLECLAFRIDTANASVCYSGDSGFSEELIELARGCTLLIMMNHYISGDEPSESYRAACGNHRDNAVLAQRAGVRTLVLTHLLPELDPPAVRREIEAEMRAEFSGDVIWGEDLLQLDVSGDRVELQRSEPSASLTPRSADEHVARH